MDHGTHPSDPWLDRALPSLRAADPEAIMFSPDAGRHPHGPLRQHGIGFRSTVDVQAMSPVIYRPAGGEPDPDDLPTRVSIAGPGVPTAASFAHDTGLSPAPEPGPRLDEDPEIEDSELVDEAEDALIDQMQDDGGDPTVAEVPADVLSAGADDDEIVGDPYPNIYSDLPVEPAPLKRPHRRRRRLLGRFNEPLDPPLAAAPPVIEKPLVAEEPPVIEEAPVVEAPPAPEEPPVDREVPMPEEPPTAEEQEPPAPVEDRSSAVEEPDDARHRRTDAAVTGHVISSRSRGLSGLMVSAVDESGTVVATAVTGRRGLYVLENLPVGLLQVRADDPVDGDHAGSATTVQVNEAETVHDVDVIVRGRVGIAAEVDVRRKKVVVTVDVIDRSTGTPAPGSVVVGNDQFSVKLPLTDGRAKISVLGAVHDPEPGDHRLKGRLRIEYKGSEHCEPANRSVRLR